MKSDLIELEKIGQKARTFYSFARIEFTQAIVQLASITPTRCTGCTGIANRHKDSLPKMTNNQKWLLLTDNSSLTVDLLRAPGQEVRASRRRTNRAEEMEALDHMNNSPLNRFSPGEVVMLLDPIQELTPGLYYLETYTNEWATLRWVRDDEENETLEVTQRCSRVPLPILELFMPIGIFLGPTT